MTVQAKPHLIDPHNLSKEELGNLVHLNGTWALETKLRFHDGTVVPVEIFISPNAIATYSRFLTGRAKAAAMNEAFGDWFYLRRLNLAPFVNQGKLIKSLTILFGGRPFRLKKWMTELFPDHRQLKVLSIALKTERVPNNNHQFGWDINRWGFAPTYDPDLNFRPMSEEEKRNYRFYDLETVLNNWGIGYFESDLLICAEGAMASGETIHSNLSFVFEFLKNHNRRPPKEVWVYVNFGSILGAKRIHEVCQQYDVPYRIIYAGSAIEVSPEGVLPGLPYTDLSHLNPGSITWKFLYDATVASCRDFKGEVVTRRCACGDVGESLDDPPNYYVILCIENLSLGIPLDPEGLMTFFGHSGFRAQVLQKIQEIEKIYGYELKNPDGESIAEIVSAFPDHPYYQAV